jgi:hypothetical protein
MTDRQTKIAQSLTVLRQVIEAGERLGLWTTASTQACEETDQWRFADVLTPDGLRFTLSGGGWNKEGQISARVACVRDPGSALQVAPSDVLRYGMAPCDAYASISRSPETIAKDLNRRVCASEEGRAQATLVRDGLASRVANRAALLGHVEKLQALGFTFNSLDGRSYWNARGHRTGVGAIEVTAQGRVGFEASAASVDLFAAVLELLTSQP